MNIGQCMSRDVKVCAPSDTLRAAANAMGKIDAGFLPVGENDRLVGMITDRDIAVRAVGEGKGVETPVGDVMTRDVQYCFEDEDIDAVARKMSDLQVRRLPVLSRDKRLVGIVSLGDISKTSDGDAGTALSRIARPGGQHRQ